MIGTRPPLTTCIALLLTLLVGGAGGGFLGSSGHDDARPHRLDAAPLVTLVGGTASMDHSAPCDAAAGCCSGQHQCPGLTVVSLVIPVASVSPPADGDRRLPERFPPPRLRPPIT